MRATEKQINGHFLLGYIFRGPDNNTTIIIISYQSKIVALRRQIEYGFVPVWPDITAWTTLLRLYMSLEKEII